MDVYWLEQTEADVPPDDDWLSASEMACLNAMRFPKRRSDWRLGRWTAKYAMSAFLNVPNDNQVLAKIEIRPATSGAPEVFIANRPAGASISLSHRSGTALCAIADPGPALGCDLELVEPRSEAFIADYFTAEERAFVTKASAVDQSTLVTLLWSAKESALKVLHEGLRLDTRTLAVSLPEPIPFSAQNDSHEESLDAAVQFQSDVWRPLRVGCANGPTFHGWWRRMGELMRTVVAAAPAAPPASLHQPHSRVSG